MKRVVLSASLVLAFVSCGRTPGVDTDGDGLFDFQELLFGTDPAVADTDFDGVIDGRDDNPLSGDPQIKLTASPAFEDESGNRCVVVGVRVLDGRGFGVSGATVDVSWGLGDLDDVVTNGSGSVNITVCSPESADTVFTANCSGLIGRVDNAHAEMELSLKRLIVPGVNTSPWENAGSIDGQVRVVTLYRNKVGLLKPFQGASVYVHSGNTDLPFQTSGPEGVVSFTDENLKGPVDVTVGAPGYRYVTYFRMDGAVLSVVLDPLDVVSEEGMTGFGTLTGEVTGFLGESGLARFPEGRVLGSDRAPIAIVQIAIKGRPLSSMSMGSVLEEPPPEDPLAVPSNMAQCDIADSSDKSCDYNSEDNKNYVERGALYTLRNIPEGQHLVFALGGTVGQVKETLTDPYLLDFEPRALGITRVSVIAGEVTTADIVMRIDLTKTGPEPVEMSLGDLPVDYKTGEPLPNGLVMPVVDTGGEGFIFVSIDGSYNFGNTDPVEVRFPAQDDPVIADLGLSMTNLAVGLAGRESYLGGDPPGISTPVRPGVQAGDQVMFRGENVWLDIPELTIPAPVPPGTPLDTVSSDVLEGVITWAPVKSYTRPDLYVLRINYLTAAPFSAYAGNYKTGEIGTYGGPKSHALWEMFVPPDMTTVTLPEFPEGFPTPYLGNPDPTPSDSTSPHRFDADTVEVELSAYVLGANGKEFDYDQNFAYDDVNLHCTVVSQDSVPVKLK